MSGFCYAKNTGLKSHQVVIDDNDARKAKIYMIKNVGGDDSPDEDPKQRDRLATAQKEINELNASIKSLSIGKKSSLAEPR